MSVDLSLVITLDYVAKGPKSTYSNGDKYAIPRIAAGDNSGQFTSSGIRRKNPVF